MMRIIAVSVIVVLFTTATTANAGVSVEPGPKKSSLVLKGRTVQKNYLKPRVNSTNIHVDTDKARVETRCTSAADEPLSCVLMGGGANEDDPDEELTEADILRAVREIGLPSLQVQIQPGEQTLVNIETIFYTEPEAFERSIELLGFDIDLSASPVSYRWVHDDGSTSTTSKPGRPYPAMDVTHRYRKPAADVRPRVDVTYRVRYRVDGGAWQTIGQTLQASGPAAELEVREAAPVLTKP